MSTQTLRTQIVEDLAKLKQEDQLLQVHRLIQSLSGESWSREDLPPFERAALEAGLKEVEAGVFYTDEEVQAEAQRIVEGNDA
jgi:hypothetical protein